MAEAAPLTVTEAARRLGLSICASGDRMDAAITGAQVSDLLSYVMAQGKAGHLWITIQAHPNIVAVAALTGLAGIVVAGGFVPNEEAVARAEEEGVPLLTSPESAYTIAGRLYELGIR